MKKSILFIFFIGIIVITNVSVLHLNKSQVPMTLTLRNIEALASPEEDNSGAAAKIEEEESHDYEEAHGRCIFYYSITTTITDCRDKGKISCTPGVEIGEPELIDIEC